MKVNVCSLDGDTDFFDIVADVLLWNTLASYQFIICQDTVIWTLINLMKEDGFTLKKAKNIWYPTQTIIDPDFTDDIVLLANTPTQAESLLHSLEQATNGIAMWMQAK